jgi:glycosyltransferase involved in cell wall biosynthesis
VNAFLLKSGDYAAWLREYGGRAGHLPYRVDHLAAEGFRVGYIDAIYRRPWSYPPVARVIDGLERIGAPFLQTFIGAPRIARSDVTIAMFESEGNALAWLRSHRFPFFSRPKLVVMACWLADLLPSFSARKRDLYRRAYRCVDLLLYFSSNQREIYEEYLGFASERLRFVPFGIDDEFFRPVEGRQEDFVLVVGRDRGRDWSTLFQAVQDTDIKVKVLCRAGEVEGQEIPANVEVLGYVDRFTYRHLLARARLVVVPNHVRAYPTGQSVTLESMSMGKCCVVTDTPAMRDYLADGDNALLVPPGDPEALRRSIDRAMGDDDLRQTIGEHATASIEDRFTARAMWGAIAQGIRGLQGTDARTTSPGRIGQER